MADCVGQQVGNYALQALLGEGGYAQVYLGEHCYLKTQAAIKMLSQRLDPPAQQAFLEEARTIASLIHPHIVRVLDFGLDNGIPFLVMDYAPHGSLRQRYPRGMPLPLPEIVPLVQQAAQAIQYAHDARRIHRDIKPENLLVGRKQEVWLSDFGLAVLAQSDYTSAPAIACTVAYVAPEQLRGKPVLASDQYSLGVIVYEWLSGELPFTGTWLEVLGQHLVTAPPPLCNKLPTLPPAVEVVVLTALAKDPKERFASVEAFATALSSASEAAGPSQWVSPGLSAVLRANTSDQAELVQPLLLDAPAILPENAHALHQEQDEAGTAPPTQPPAAPSVNGAAAPDPSSRRPSENAPRARGRGLVAFRTVHPAPQRRKTTERLAMSLLLVTLLCLAYGFLGLGWFNPTHSGPERHTGLAPIPPRPAASGTVTVAPSSTSTALPTTPTTAIPPAGANPGASPTPTANAGPHCQLSSSIPSNFNGTPIPAGDFVWFSSVLKVQGLQGLTSPITLRFDQQTITFSGVSLIVPQGQVTFTPGATIATTMFGVAWQTNTSTTGSGNTFLSGVAYHAVTGLSGGITPVTWSGTWFIPAGLHLTVTWQWAAAVYTSFTSSYGNLGVKPVDDPRLSAYQNADHAGTPENVRQDVTGGARGGGGSNYTGGVSGPASGQCP